MSDITDQGPVWSLTDVAIGVPSGGSLNWVDLFYGRTVSVDPQVTTLQFEGDDTSQTIDEVTRYDLTILSDKGDFDAIQQIFGKTRVTGISGADWALYMNDDAEIAGATVAVRYTLKFKDESVSPSENTYLRYFWPLCVAKLVRPQTVEWKAKHVFQLNLTAEKTTVDAAGVALAGVPSGGAPFRIERLSA